MKKNWFLIGLFVAVLFAFLLPEGIQVLPFDLITDIGVGLIFFFYGLKLSLGELKTGLSNYRVHLLVQLATFLLFPLLVLPFYPVFSATVHENWWLAFFFLAALPSTVSSSVVMVSLARGNVSAAIFNASLSGLIGLVLTPFWLQLFMDSSEGFEVGRVILNMVYQIILPLIAGLILSPYLKKTLAPFLKKSGIFDKAVIVLIVYSSFSHAFALNIFSELGFLGFVLILTGILFLFTLVYTLLRYLTKLFHFSTDNKITAEFCGAQKSLVHGSAMGKIMFPAAQLSIFLLPIMLYHVLQLVIIAVIAERYRKKGW
jgi:sodium/bile acid cotransporter 7